MDSGNGLSEPVVPSPGAASMSLGGIVEGTPAPVNDTLGLDRPLSSDSGFNETAPILLPEVIFVILDHVFNSVPEIHTNNCCDVGSELHALPPGIFTFDPALDRCVQTLTWNDVVNLSLVNRTFRSYTLPHLFHKVGCTSGGVTSLYTRLESLLISPFGCNPSIRMVKSIKITHDSATSAPPVPPEGHLVMRMITSLTEIKVEAVDFSLPRFSMGVRQSESALHWWTAMPPFIVSLVRQAVHQGFESAELLRSLSFKGVVFDQHTLHALFSPTLKHLKVIHGCVGVVTRGMNSDELPLPWLVAPWTPQWKWSGWPLHDPALPYAIRELELDGADVFDCDFSYLFSDEMPFEVSFPFLEAVNIEDPQFNFMTTSHTPYTFHDFMARLIARAPNLRKLRLPAQACQDRAEVFPLLRGFKDIEFIHDISQNYEDSASLIPSTVANMVSEDESAAQILETITVSIVNGGPFTGPNSIVSVYRYQTSLQASFEAANITLGKPQATYYIPPETPFRDSDQDTFALAMLASLDWEALGKQLCDEELFPRWNRLVVDLRKLEGVRTKWVLFLRFCLLRMFPREFTLEIVLLGQRCSTRFEKLENADDLPPMRSWAGQAVHSGKLESGPHGNN